MAAMVVPNIGALLAWGLITALFIPTGWIPNETFAKLVGPMILYLLPILIGYAGGRLVYDVRGGVVGAAATMGAIAEVQKSGKAIHFLLETNPGPGLGLLLAYWVAGKGTLKQSAPGAMIIHFLGGIHEIYFPYVLAKPVMILAMWAGGILADLWFVIWGAGLVATP